MTLTRGSKRSKFRDLLIIIRLFIHCVAIVLVNWLTYMVQSLPACLQYTLATFSNAQSKQPQSVACIKGEYNHRTICYTFQRRRNQGANQAKNKTKTHDHHNKRGDSGVKRMNCSYLQPPPVKELIFTKDDVWNSKNFSSKSTQPQLRVYSGASLKCNPDMRKTHSNRFNYSPISFSREVQQSFPRAKSSHVPTVKIEFASRCNLRLLQRNPRLQPKRPNCRYSRPTSVRPRFTTLSQANTENQVRESLKKKYARQATIKKLMKRDIASDDPLLSKVKTWNECSSSSQYSPFAIDSEHYCTNSCVPNKEKMRADFASEKASIPLEKRPTTKELSSEQTAAAAVESRETHPNSIIPLSMMQTVREDPYLVADSDECQSYSFEPDLETMQNVSKVDHGTPGVAGTEVILLESRSKEQ